MNVPDKILIIQTAFPGDAILTLPMIQLLKNKNEDVLIDVLCIPSTKEIFEASPYVNSAIAMDKKDKHKSVFSLMKFIRTLKKNDYDKIICPHKSLRSAIITIGLGVKDTIGFENSTLMYAFKKVVKYNPEDHEVKRNLSLIDFENLNGDWKILPEIKINDDIKKKVSELLNGINRQKLIAFAPGSVWETKKYPKEYYAKIISQFISSGYNIVLIGGEEDKILCNDLKNNLSNVINSAGLLSLVESIELLKNSKFLICNDSAPTHLGMCADIPVLTIYCSTVPGFGFYPYNEKSGYVSYDDLNCKPCGIHGHDACPLGTFVCAKYLEPDLVIKEAEKLIRQYGNWQ